MSLIACTFSLWRWLNTETLENKVPCLNLCILTTFIYTIFVIIFYLFIPYSSKQRLTCTLTPHTPLMQAPHHPQLTAAHGRWVPLVWETQGRTGRAWQGCTADWQWGKPTYSSKTPTMVSNIRKKEEEREIFVCFKWCFFVCCFVFFLHYFRV